MVESRVVMSRLSWAVWERGKGRDRKRGETGTAARRPKVQKGKG